MFFTASGADREGEQGMSTKTEIESSIAEMNTMIAAIEADGGDASTYHRIVENYFSELENLRDADNDAAAERDRSHSLTARPKAGGAARNQYGTFEVHYCTQKQTNYIKFLMDTRDLSKADGTKLNIAELRQQVAATQVNKKAASAIIDFLLALPELPKTTVPDASSHDLDAPATDRQKNFVRTLLAERSGNDLAETIRRSLNEARVNLRLTYGFMSEVISSLKAIPANKIPDGKYALPAEDGHFVFYQIDNPTEGKWAGYTFVSQLVGSVGRWSEQRLSRQVSDSVKARIAANVEEAARMFGIKAKACSYCSSPLSNIQSRAAGYGETCAHNHGFFYPTEAEAREILAERGES